MTMEKIIEIPGDYGSGGGQILRTALGLATLTGKACRITNIRAKRKNPGLREQHLQAVNALAKLCDAKVEGNKIGSREVVFEPGKIQEKPINIRIGTAGSVGLVLQALLIPAIKHNLYLRIEGGGTYGKWAPPVSYISSVIGYFLRKISCIIDIRIEREGFYPKGGAIVEVKTRTEKPTALIAIEKGKLLEIGGVSVASEYLKKARVAERQASTASQLLKEKFKIEPKVKYSYSKSVCPGSGLQLYAKTENSILGANSFGERGKRSEVIGKEAAEQLIWEYENGTVDSHASDQLIPYLGIAGGKIKTSKITEHCKTNIYVTEKFLPVKFFVKDNIIEARKI